MKTDMYPDSEKLKKETMDYINSTNPGFLAKYSEKRWNSYFEKSIHSKVYNLINNLLYIKWHLIKNDVK